VREARRIIDLARSAMTTRSRDLDAFAYGDPRDVRIAEDTRGLAFALIGMIAERRKPDAPVYGVVTLRNGVPIGYMDLVLSGSQVEISFNTFSTYRDGEAARVFVRTLAMARRVFGSKTFLIGPYALGHRNPEAIDSGRLVVLLQARAAAAPDGCAAARAARSSSAGAATAPIARIARRSKRSRAGRCTTGTIRGTRGTHAERDRKNRRRSRVLGRQLGRRAAARRRSRACAISCSTISPS
jgi:hypothetical protein